MKILDMARNISKSYEALSNEIRVLILAIVISFNKARWIEIRNTLEKILDKRINPNLLAFHLRKLIEYGLIEKNLDIYSANITPSIENGLKNLVAEIKDIIKNETLYSLYNKEHC